jgi:hypothetical protein
MKIATLVTLTVVGARRGSTSLTALSLSKGRLAPTVDSRPSASSGQALRGNDEREVIFKRARALHPFYLTAWVFLPDPAAAGHSLAPPAGCPTGQRMAGLGGCTSPCRPFLVKVSAVAVSSAVTKQRPTREDSSSRAVRLGCWLGQWW